LTLRLLLDVAKRKKFTLYVMFVDFSQAYDRVPGTTLFSVMRRLGCGAVVLAAVGVRAFFLSFINDLIKLLRESCECEGFLSWLHALVLMDDTVHLSTSRNGMAPELSFFNQFCNTHGVIILEKRRRFCFPGWC